MDESLFFLLRKDLNIMQLIWDSNCIWEHYLQLYFRWRWL